MQKKQHQQFSTLHAGMQLWNEQGSLSIRYCKVSAGNGFTAPDSYRDGKMNSDKIRPWIER